MPPNRKLIYIINIYKYSDMDKKKYIAPFCRTSLLDPEMLVAASKDENFSIFNEEGLNDDAVMSNEQRPNSGSIWDQGW